MILPISASQVAQITGVSYQHPTRDFLLSPFMERRVHLGNGILRTLEEIQN
jgi:hypothetical protein